MFDILEQILLTESCVGYRLLEITDALRGSIFVVKQYLLAQYLSFGVLVSINLVVRVPFVQLYQRADSYVIVVRVVR